jgi:2-oxoisovalerate dehydrogenase E1 component alpha subunit
MALSDDTLLDMYWYMLLARRLDEQAWQLHRQGKIAFHLSCIGHEAIGVGAAYALRAGFDWAAPYYRDLALMLVLGLTARDYALNLKGKKGDPASDGRQMPEHWSMKTANVISASSVAAAQVSQAVGIAMGIKYRAAGSAVLVCTGEGASASGEWYESVNWAAVQKLPVVFLIENNQYAVSMRQEAQMGVEKPSEKSKGLGVGGLSVDGTNLQAVYNVLEEALFRARSGDGPSIVEARTYRITPHSSDDDDRTYRTKAEVDAYRRRDPVRLLRAQLQEDGILSVARQKELEEEAKQTALEAFQYAEQAPYPAPEDAAGPVFDRGDELCLPRI